jgi:hypothetical protein
MELNVQLHSLEALPPRKRAPSTQLRGGWVGPKACLYIVEKRNLAMLGNKLSNND